MPTPSLLIVPARFKSGKLYSQLPTSGAGDFTVTRATAATRVNASGYIESVASGIPRLDYFASGGVVGCPALIVEPSGQNLAFYSEQFDNAYWSKLRVNTSNWANQEIAPNNTLTAEKLTQASGETQAGVVFRSLTVSSGQVHTFSVFAKKGSRDFVALFSNLTGPTLGAYFDINNGTVGTISAGYSAKIENYGNGWFRCSITATSNSTSHIFFIYGVSANNTFTVPDDGGFQFIWGAQLETGSVATSYIPTTTAAVTRNADVISVSGAVSGSIGQASGTIYAEVDLRSFAASVARRIVNIRVDGNNVLSLEMNAAGNGFDFLARSGGTGVIATASGITTGIYKIAVGYNSAASGTVLYVNGVLRDTKTIAIPNLSAAVFSLGTRADGEVGSQLNDRIRAVALYTTRLSNAELAALTTP